MVTVAGSTTSLPGTDPGTIKITPLSEFPAKGRATGGIRCHTMRKGEDGLLFARVASIPLRAAGPQGPVELPIEFSKRDATGSPLATSVVAIAGGHQ